MTISNRASSTLGLAKALAVLLLMTGGASGASAAIVQRAPVQADITITAAPCPGDCAAPFFDFSGTFDLIRSPSGTKTTAAFAFDGVDGESSHKDHKGSELMLALVGESISFALRGSWLAPTGGPVPIPYPNLFAFAAGTSPEGLLPSSGDGPQLLLGTIDSPLFDPFEVSGLIFAFDQAGGATQVGGWSVRLAPAEVPEPETLLLALVGVAAVAMRRRRIDARRATDVSP